jgi:glutathione S-transferase
MLTLYQFNNSVCSQKVRIALCEKGLEWETREVNLFKSEQYDPDYLALNPKGVVPTLVHDGRPVIESTLICEYLDDAFPDPGLVPRDAHAKARMRLWSKAVDEGLHDGVTVLSFSAMFRERMRAMPAAERERRYKNVGDPVRSDRHKSAYEQGIEAPHAFRAIAAYEKAFKNAEDGLAAGGPWLAGEGFSLADINLMPYAARLENLTLLDVWIDGRPRTRDWWDRAKARPSFEAALNGPLSEEELAEMSGSGAKIRQRVSEIRADYLAQFPAA